MLRDTTKESVDVYGILLESGRIDLPRGGGHSRVSEEEPGGVDELSNSKALSTALSKNSVLVSAKGGILSTRDKRGHHCVPGPTQNPFPADSVPMRSPP